jgi:hypothetical protein
LGRLERVGAERNPIGYLCVLVAAC